MPILGDDGKRQNGHECPTGQGTMKKLRAIIQSFKLDEVKVALHEIGVQSMMVTSGNRIGQVTVEIIIEDALVERAAEAVERAARTDKIVELKIFIIP